MMSFSKNSKWPREMCVRIIPVRSSFWHFVHFVAHISIQCYVNLNVVHTLFGGNASSDTIEHIRGCGDGAGNNGAGGGGGDIIGGNGGMHLNTIMGLTYSAFQQLMSSTASSTASALAAATTTLPTLQPNSTQPPPSSSSSSSSSLSSMTQTAMGALSHSNSVLNPIDRLYSMQNAYFRCDKGAFQSHISDGEMEH